MNGRGEVVANCHRRPAAEFARRRLSVDEIADAISELAEGPLARRSILLTVSPVRHTGDGLAGNAVSKSRAAAGGRGSSRSASDGSNISPPTKSLRTTCGTTASMPTIWCTPHRRPWSTSGSGSRRRPSPTRPGACFPRPKPSRPPRHYRPRDPRSAAHRAFCLAQLERIAALHGPDFSGRGGIFPPMYRK